MMFNPLLKMTKADLKSICFGCEECKDNPFDVFVTEKDDWDIRDTVWLRTLNYGVYFEYNTRKAGGSDVSRNRYCFDKYDRKVKSYEELVQIMVSRGYKDWFSR